MKKLLFLLIANLGIAQTLQPTIGVGWTGGLSYDMEQELPSAQVGIIYTSKVPDIIMNSVAINANYYYDFVSEKPNNVHSYYVLKLQFAKEFVKYWNLTYYGGYINDFHNNLMSHYDGPFKSNLAYGIGLQITDDHMIGQLMYESLGGYPNLSVGVIYKFRSLIKLKNK